LPQLSVLNLDGLKLCDDGFRWLQTVESLDIVTLVETPIELLGKFRTV